MKEKEIELSPKHGLNPSLVKCFWCGKHKGLVLLGKMVKGEEDPEAPKEMILDLEPCDDCKKRFSEGILLIEVTEDGTRFSNNRNFQMKSSEGQIFYPTGRFCVLREGAVENMSKGSFALTDAQTMDKLLNLPGKDVPRCQKEEANDND